MKYIRETSGYFPQQHAERTARPLYQTQKSLAGQRRGFLQLTASEQGANPDSSSQLWSYTGWELGTYGHISEALDLKLYLPSMS